VIVTAVEQVVRAARAGAALPPCEQAFAGPRVRCAAVR
jgi:hypothetical protein